MATITIKGLTERQARCIASNIDDFFLNDILDSEDISRTNILEDTEIGDPEGDTIFTLTCEPADSDVEDEEEDEDEEDDDENNTIVI